MQQNTSSKIPVRDVKPSLHNEKTIMERSRKDKERMATYSANFNQPMQGGKERSKSLESNQKMSEKNKELRYWVSSLKKIRVFTHYVRWVVVDNLFFFWTIDFF